MASTIHFTIAARELPTRPRGKTTISTIPDPYIRLSQKDGRSDWTEVLKTKHFMNTSNPEWLEVNTFEWKRFSCQQWKIDLYDFDVLSKDDLIGSVEINVDDFVLSVKTEYVLTLPNGGCIVLKKTKPFLFRLQAENLPMLDLDSASDPYVVCFWSYNHDGELHKFHKTETIEDAVNAKWDEVIAFTNYQRGTNQYLTFKVYDKDLLKDDKIGTVTFHMDSYLRQYSQVIYRLNGPEAGDATITITPVY